MNLQADHLDDVGEVDVVFDVIGGEIRDRSAGLVRAGGTLVTIASPPLNVRPGHGRAIFFVVEPDRGQLAALVQRLRDGRLKPIVTPCTLTEARAAFASDRPTPGKTVIRVTEDREGEQP